MEEILLSLTIGILVIVAYTLGLRNGQKVFKGEQVELPKPTIGKVTRQIEENEYDKEVEKTSIIIDNIENYKGDGTGQREVI